MKKTTWVIIGLSVCVVALSIALVVVITQTKTTAILTDEPDNIIRVMYAPKLWQPNRPFSIASDYTKTKIYYYGYYGAKGVLYSIPESELDKTGDFLGKSLPGIPYKVYFTKRPFQKREQPIH